MHEDLWAEEIWKRLPMESLCRFRCVCKRWNSILSSPSFIKFHYMFTLCTTPCNLKPYLHVSYRDQVFYPRFRDIEFSSHEHYTLYRPLDNGQQQLYFPFRPEKGARNPEWFDEFWDAEDTGNPRVDEEDAGNPKRCTFVGVIHGVVCISYSACSTCLWNPSINKCVALPCLSLARGAIGFGYDTSKDDFKVVVIDYLSSGKKSSLMVYSPQQDIWRHPVVPEIECLDENWIFDDEVVPSCFVNGTIHWLLYKVKILEDGLISSECSVLMFNCKSEEVTRMDIPREVCGSKYKLVLFEYDGKLAALVQTQSSSRVNLWVMEEHGVSTSWKKIKRASYGLKNERKLSTSILCDHAYNKGMFLMDHPKARSYTNQDAVPVLISDFLY